MMPTIARIAGRRRPLIKCASFSTPKPTAWDRPKVYRTNGKDVGIHLDLSNPLRRHRLLVGSAVLFGAFGFYQGMEIIPTGFVGVQQNTGSIQVVPAGWRWRWPWEPRLQQYSTQHQSIQIRTRVLDSKRIKVFVSVLIQFKLENVEAFLEKNSKKEASLWTNPQAFHEDNYQDGPTRLKSLVTRHCKQVIEQVVSKESAIDVDFGVRGGSVVDLSAKLQKQLQQVDELVGLKIHSVTITNLEFPHWAHESIEKQMQKSWAMEKFIEKRKVKQIQQQRDAREQLRQFADAVTKEDREEHEDNGDGEQ